MTFDWLHNIYKIEDESLPNADAVIALQKLQMHSHIVHTNTHTNTLITHSHTHTTPSVCCWFFLCLLLTFKHLLLPTVDCGFYKNCRVSFCLVSLALAKCCTHSAPLFLPLFPLPFPLSLAALGLALNAKVFRINFFPVIFRLAHFCSLLNFSGFFSQCLFDLCDIIRGELCGTHNLILAIASCTTSSSSNCCRCRCCLCCCF